jgi:hypothetical protein
VIPKRAVVGNRYSVNPIFYRHAVRRHRAKRQAIERSIPVRTQTSIYASGRFWLRQDARTCLTKGRNGPT